VHDEDVLGRAYDGRLMRRIWEVTRPHKKLVLLSLALFPLAAALELLQPYLVKLAIDNYILERDWVGLGHVALLFSVSLAALYGLRVAQAYVTQLTGQRVIHDLRAALFAHLQSLDARFYDRNPVGRLMTRLLNDVDAINELFTSGVVSIFADLLLVAGIVVIMLGMNWKLALVAFALAPVLGALGLYFRARARRSYREVRTRLARLNAYLQESLSGMAVIQLFAREHRERASFGRLNGELRHAQFQSTFYDASFYALVETMGSAAVAFVVWYGGGEILRGALTFGGLVAFLEYLARAFMPLRDLGNKYTVMQAAMVSAERIFGLLDTRPAIASPAPSVAARAPVGADEATPAVEFRNVWFAYDAEQWVLRDCSFTVARGEHVALVGPTGEGKTTIVRLMTRAYDVARGQVLVEGRDVREWDLTALRRHVGLVPQEVFLWSGSVEANLTLGRDGQVARDELDAAVTAANANRLLDALPGGVRAEVRERGVNLSHGQRQLLAIARALIYNPPVLALDEATSSVDPEAEALIRAGMRRLTEGRTSVIIAHRLSTIQQADRILVLHRGAVREAGRHADLYRQGGLYARLWELQFGVSAR
jgi:ATP-binding cassette, subfamily B, multidrug efflux pump